MIQILRRISQFSALVISNSYFVGLFTRFIYNGPLKGFCVPILNCYACPLAVFACPIGTIQHFLGLHMIPFYVLGVLGFLGLLAGTMACGWLCPFGLLQELMFKLSKKEIFLPKALSYIKYAVLVIMVILLPWFTGQPWFSRLCPAGTLTAAIPWLILDPINPIDGTVVNVADFVGDLFFLKLLILFLLLFLFVVAKRPFCKILCPLGALFSLFNKISFLKLHVKGQCKSCLKCETACVSGISVNTDTNGIDCCRCLKCVECENVKVSFLPELPQGRQKNAGLTPLIKNKP
ncbi:MAG: 4Fe-4S binding protein [Deltaproteobacteria bacterium]|nr:4Fe-4S binding protein [Deltaproteobacteria bacterium]